MTEENPHKILLMERIHNGPTDFSLECQAEGCNWKIPTTPQFQHGARQAAQEHIDIWALRRTNEGNVKLIANLSAQRDTFQAAVKAATAANTELDAILWDASVETIPLSAGVGYLAAEYKELKELRRKLSEGELSDGYHTHNELYAHRRLLTLHAVHAWLAAGYQVVKSWNHSDGQPAFGGGWFIIVAQLPGKLQVSYHYEEEHWNLFDIPEADNAPEYDGHSADDVVSRLSHSSYEYADDMTALGRDSAILNALYAGGVDNWEGYELSLEEMDNAD